MNSKFLATLFRCRRRLFFSYAYTTEAFIFLLRIMLLIWPVIHSTVKPHSLPHTCCYRMYICVTACFVLEFSCCVSRSAPLSPNGMTSCGDRYETVAVWSQNTDAICDYRPQDTLLLKGARTNCLYMLMPKVYGFVMIWKF